MFKSWKFAVEILEALIKLATGESVTIRPSYDGHKYEISIKRMS